METTGVSPLSRRINLAVTVTFGNWLGTLSVGEL